MINGRADLGIVTFSVKVYQTLLVAYPARFRQEYGSQMVQVFQDCCLRALGHGGANGMVRLWAVTLLDLMRSVLEQHLHQETDMSESKLVKFSGWAFILGAFAFITILTGSDAAAMPGSLISAILLGVGMLGLRARYGEKAGGFGRTVLLVSVIAMILLYLGIMFLAVAVQVLPALRLQAESLTESGLWILLFGGPAILLLGLTLFGLAALRSKPMPRFNWLPGVAGIWYPAFYFSLSGYLFTNNGQYPAQYQTGFNILFLIQFAALCVLGAILVSDTPQEMAAA